MSEMQPSRQPRDLAEVVEMLLDKGIVINADIVVSIGQRELLGVEVRAAIASFETAAKYGLAFPSGTDPERLRAAADLDEPIDAPEGDWSAMPDASRGGTRAIDAPVGDAAEAEGEDAKAVGEDAKAEGEAADSDDAPVAPTRSPGPAQTPESTTIAQPEGADGSDADEEGGASDGDETADRCKAITADGERCSRSAGEDGFCFQHDSSDDTVDEPEADGDPDGGGDE